MSFLPFARKAALGFTTRHFLARSSTWQKHHRTYTKPLLWSAALATLVLHQAIRLDAEPAEDTFSECLTVVLCLSSDSLKADPATSIAFPTALTIPSKITLPTLSLVGAGVRTVSFLRIQVYSVGFYADLNNPNLKVSDTDCYEIGRHPAMRGIDNSRHDTRRETQSYRSKHVLCHSYW